MSHVFAMCPDTTHDPTHVVSQCGRIGLRLMTRNSRCIPASGTVTNNCLQFANEIHGGIRTAGYGVRNAMPWIGAVRVSTNHDAKGSDVGQASRAFGNILMIVKKLP